MFKLSGNSISDYLESIEQFTDRAIACDVTAGLRQIYRRNDVDPLDVLPRLVGSRRKGGK